MGTFRRSKAKSISVYPPGEYCYDQLEEMVSESWLDPSRSDTRTSYYELDKHYNVNELKEKYWSFS